MLVLPKQFADEIIAHALEDDPNECCGIVASKNGKATKLFRVTNSEHSPHRYNMDSKELFQVFRELDNNGWDLLAIYHSHTHTEAYPSATDTRLAAYPEAYYILVSLMNKQRPILRAFRIIDKQITEEKLEFVNQA